MSKFRINVLYLFTIAILLVFSIALIFRHSEDVLNVVSDLASIIIVGIVAFNKDLLSSKEDKNDE